MIILITGQPGSGKSALCVDMIAHDEQFTGRPLFVGGIPDLKIDHEPVPPVAEWTEMRAAPEDPSLQLAYFTFPAKSLIVVDEAQRIYRPRAAGSKVPPEVAAFETHRHTGVDFILLTQHPGLLDANIRKLVGRHIHIAVTPFGRRRYEWTKCVDPELKTERDIAAQSKYVLPKRAFDLYKSSELHTKIKVKIPFYFWLMIGAFLLLLGVGWYIYKSMSSKVSPGQGAQQITQPGQTGQGASPGQHAPPKSSPAAFIQSLEPRFPGLHHTAPRYDAMTQPQDAPWPAGCWITRDTCKCVDQQGNKYLTTDGICRQIVENGIFKDWQSPNDRANATAYRDAPPARRGAGSDTTTILQSQPNDPPAV